MTLTKNLSKITLHFDNLDKDIVERELNMKLMTRTRSCHVIMNLTQIEPNFGIFKRIGEIKGVLEKYREHSDKIIKETTILVNSRPAKFIARIFLKLAQPSCPAKIEIIT